MSEYNKQMQRCKYNLYVIVAKIIYNNILSLHVLYFLLYFLLSGKGYNIIYFSFYS